MAEMSNWQTAGNYKSVKTKYLHTGLSEDLEAYSKKKLIYFVHFLSHHLQRRRVKRLASTRHSSVDEAADGVSGRGKATGEVSEGLF